MTAGSVYTHQHKASQPMVQTTVVAQNQISPSLRLMPCMTIN